MTFPSTCLSHFRYNNSRKKLGRRGKCRGSFWGNDLYEIKRTSILTANKEKVAPGQSRCLPPRAHPWSHRKGHCRCLSPQDGQWETSGTKQCMPLLLNAPGQPGRVLFERQSLTKWWKREDSEQWDLTRNQVRKAEAYFLPSNTGPHERGHCGKEARSSSCSPGWQPLQPSDTPAISCKWWNAVTWLLKYPSFVNRKAVRLLLWTDLHRNYHQWYSANKKGITRKKSRSI